MYIYNYIYIQLHTHDHMETPSYIFESICTPLSGLRERSRLREQFIFGKEFVFGGQVVFGEFVFGKYIYINNNIYNPSSEDNLASGNSSSESVFGYTEFVSSSSEFVFGK